MDKTLEEKNPILVRIIVIVVLIVCAVLLVLGISGIASLGRDQNQISATRSIRKNTTIEEIDFDSGKVNVYFFWGNGCPHCENLWEYFEELEEQYGDKFVVYGFEVWDNDDNLTIKDKLAEAVGDDDRVGSDTVPYFVIGDQSYLGYNSSKNDEILNLILDGYKNIDQFNQHRELRE